MSQDHPYDADSFHLALQCSARKCAGVMLSAQDSDGITRHGIVQYSTVQYSTVQYSTVQYSAG